MQRWILLSVVLFLGLLAGSTLVGYRIYKLNRPHPVWVPLPINPELPGEKKAEIAADLKTKLGTQANLLKISKDLGLAKKLGLGSDEEAARAVATRLFVRVGEADGPMGAKVPSINVGVSGKEKDQKVSEEIALRLIVEVRQILEIKAP